MAKKTVQYPKTVLKDKDEKREAINARRRKDAKKTTSW